MFGLVRVSTQVPEHIVSPPAHVGSQNPSRHVEPPGQVPHDPPQPSEPHSISAQSGIGYLTMNAREFLQTDVVLVGILLYALLGKLADVLAKGLEHWWLRWHPGYQAKEK